MPEFRFSPNNTITPEVTLLSEETGCFVYRLSWEAAEPVRNLEFSVLLPMKGVASTFYATAERDRYVHQWFAARCATESNFYNGAPFCTVCDGDRVLESIALSDAVNDTAIRFSVNDFDEEEQVAFIVQLLTGDQAKASYSVDIRVDTRALMLPESMQELSAWWEGYYPVRAEIPAVAEEPLYSTWYNFHQHPNRDALVPELTLAKELGFGSVILDDGWQFDGRGTGDYSCCGDWAFSAEKFPNGTKELLEIGLPLSVWFCVPFVGWETKAYQRFKDKLLYEDERNRCGILDVRYGCAREFIINNLLDFVKRYGVQGLKLDFIDSFKIMPETPAANGEMDVPDLSQAVIRLLSDLGDRLTAVCPGAMIEFRQNYIGPAITRFCNMLRVGDCAFDSHVNRRRLTDLRLLDYPLAVHSDMLYWAHDESVENCARQLLSVLFSVPQISVLLTEQSEAQIAAIRTFIAYWKANREILLRGGLFPHRQDMDYPMIEASGEGKRICVLYTERPVTVSGPTDLFNATENTRMILDMAIDATVSVIDACGAYVSVSEPLTAGLNAIEVPIGGRAELR